MLADPSVDAVSIATPPRTHYPLVRQALEAGKHVLVEKPLATNSVDAEALVDLAERKGLVLMPGHTFLYSPAVNKVRELIDSGELGELYFITSSRMNLGIYQPDGVVNDLAPARSLDPSLLAPAAGVDRVRVGLARCSRTASPRPRSSRSASSRA